MSDEIDVAAELELLNTQIALANREKLELRSPVCRNSDCCQPSLEGSSYCCSECCEDHARELWTKRNRRAA